LSWTASSAQTGKVCYDSLELAKIASKIVRAKECDTLLILAEKRILFKDSTINVQKTALVYADSTINLKDKILLDKDHILLIKEEELTVTTLLLKKKSTQLKLAKTGIGAVLLAWVLSSIL